MRRDELEARPAFELKRGRRRLVQFGGGFGKLLEGHRRDARLEKDFRVGDGVAVEDVFEVQPGVGGDEKAARARRVLEAPNAVVARAMRAVGGVVADDGGEVSEFEGGVGHKGAG